MKTCLTYCQNPWRNKEDNQFATFIIFPVTTKQSVPVPGYRQAAGRCRGQVLFFCEKMPPNAKVSPLRTSTRVSISCLSMASASPFSCFSTWPGVFSAYSQLKPHSSLLQHRRRDLPCPATASLNSTGSGAAFATGNLIGDLASLLDAGRAACGRPINAGWQ